MDRAPLTAADFGSAVTAITSAFGDPTRREIYLLARDTENGVTATTAAEHFKLHTNVARHHLDKLAGGGYLEVTVDRQAGSGAGRPSKRYRVTDPGIGFDLPVRRDDLIISLLGKALSLLSTEQAEQMAEEVGAEYGRVLAASMNTGGDAQRTFRSALHAIADALTAHGFAAHAENDGNALRIVSEHCPFGGEAIENPVICAVDRGMVRGMLAELVAADATTDLSSSLPMGDDVCITSVTG